MGSFVTVFDARTLGWAPWAPAIIGGILVLFSIVFFFKREVMMPSRSEGARRAISLSALALFVVWTGFAAWQVAGGQRQIEAALKAEKVGMVVGRVSRYKPQFGGGTLQEVFCIDRPAMRPQCFAYSDYIPSAGFHTTAMAGGPVGPDALLRVYYTGNIIIRLDAVPQARLPAAAAGTE